MSCWNLMNLMNPQLICHSLRQHASCFSSTFYSPLASRHLSTFFYPFASVPLSYSRIGLCCMLSYSFVCPQKLTCHSDTGCHSSRMHLHLRSRMKETCPWDRAASQVGYLESNLHTATLGLQVPLANHLLPPSSHRYRGAG